MRTARPLNEDNARELYLFAINDSDTYHRSIQSAIANLTRKAKRGIYDKELAVKLWFYTACFGATRYCAEFGGRSTDIFSVADRKETARMLEESFREDCFAF